MSVSRLRLWRAFVITMSVSAPSIAAAQSAPAPAPAKAACIAAFEQGTELRAARKLTEARQRLLECGGAGCPMQVQTECAKELDFVNQSLPSIALGARDEANRDLVEGRVLVDGTPRELDGRAVSLDPGRHAVRFEMTGCEPVEQLVLINEGERNRPIIGSLRCSAATAAPNAATPSSPSASPSAAASASSSSEARSRVLPLALAGVGLVGIVGFAYFGTLGKAEVDDIRSTGCAPSCNRDAVINARTKLVVADVFGAVGLVSLGAAAYFAFLAPSSSTAPSAPATTFDVRPDRGGGSVLVRTRF